MKKYFIVALILLLTVSFVPVFAADDLSDTSTVYSAVTSPYQKTSAQMLAMGGAGIATSSNQDALYVNPANLANKGLVFNIPNVSVTLFNPYAMLSGGVVDNIIDEGFSTGLTNSLGTFLNMYGSGKNSVANIDAGLGFKAGPFAMAIDSKVQLHTYQGSSVSNLSVIPQVDVVASMGFGFRLFADSPVSLDLGAAVRYDIRAYYNQVNFSDTLTALLDESADIEDLFLNQTPLAIGFSIPIDVGATVNFPLGFKAAVTATNLNGNFYMAQLDSLQTLLDNAGFSDVFTWGVFDKGTTYKYYTDFSLNVGLGWKPELGKVAYFIEPTIAIDLVDIVGLCEDFSGVNLLSRLKIGAELQLFKLFELRAGLNQGYASLGVGLNLFNVIHLEVSYFTTEFGQSLGYKDVDALAVRLNLFWER